MLFTQSFNRVIIFKTKHCRSDIKETIWFSVSDIQQ